MVDTTPRVFTALDFLSTFFSILKNRDVNVVSATKVFETIGRHRDKYLALFIDIDITHTGETVCSQDLEESISMLQIIGAVGKANPRYERIILKMNKAAAKEIIECCPNSYLKMIECFTDEFLEENKETT